MYAFVLLDWAVTLIHHQTQYYHRVNHPPTIVGPVIEVDNAHTAVHTIVNGYVQEAVTQLTPLSYTGILLILSLCLRRRSKRKINHVSVPPWKVRMV